MEPRISAVINTFNEEKNLPYALRSVQTWVDEIIVIDMHSTDRTVEIAREFGAKVYFHEPTGFVEPARNFAISKSSGDWIMVLDADEIIPEPLSRKLKEVAQDKEGVDAVRLARLNYLFGSPMGYTGWGPCQDNKNLRFFKRGRVNANATIHDLLKPAPGAHIIEIPYQDGCAIIHFNHVDISQFIEKLNRYTTIEAQQAMKRGEKSNSFRALCRAAVAFWIRYIGWQGFREGWRGFYLCMFMAFYRLVTTAKLTELRTIGARADVEKIYCREADRILADYTTQSE